MKPKQGKRVVYVAGAILAAVVVACLFSSGLLITQYHLILLRYDEAYLEELLRGDPHEVQRAAIEEYLQGAHGREHIVKLFIEAFQEKTRDVRSQFKGEAVVTGVLVFGDLYMCGFQYGDAGGATNDELREGRDNELIRVIAPLLRSLPAETLTVEAYPGLKISLLPGDQVCSEARTWCHLIDGRIRTCGVKKSRGRPSWVTDDDIKALAKGIGLVLRRVESHLTE